MNIRVLHSTSLRPFRLTALAAGIMLCGSPASLQAQENQAQTIVVTADRQETLTGELSSTIYAIGEDSLETVSAVHLNEFMQRVPGVWISRHNGQESLTAIRSPVFSGAGSCGSFQMSQDGIPLRGAGFCNVNQMFEANTEQAGNVEVILGPGSVLFGANALHGAINVLTPGVTEDFMADIALEAGPNDYGRLKTSVSDSGDTHGYRINFNGSHDGGYKDDSGVDQQKLDLVHRYTGSDLTVTTVLNATNLNQETAGYLVAGYEAYKDDSLKKSNPNPEAYRDAESLRLHSKVQWEVEYGEWQVTPYYRKNDMAFLQHFLPGTPLEKNGHESFGLQSMYTFTDRDSMQWSAGVDLEYSDGFLDEFQESPGFGPFPQGQHYDFDVQSTLISPYVLYGFVLNEDNRINLGVRYEQLDYDYDNHMLVGNTADDGTPCPGAGCRFSRPADRSDDFSNFSAHLGWVHDIDSERQLFVNVSRAFRAPQTNELYRLQVSQQVADLDSEDLVSYEFGYRAGTERLNYNLSFYWMDKENVIFQDSDRNNVSGAETSHRGVDFSGRFMLTDSLSLDVVASYGRHRYENNPSLFGVAVNLEGNTIDTAPEWTGSSRLAWAMADNHNLELEFIYMDEYYTDDENSPDHIYEGHELFNLRYRADFDNWYFSARVTNLLDVDYAERADISFGNDRYFVGESRSLFLTVGTRFR